jgi:hypothetical protein
VCNAFGVKNLLRRILTSRRARRCSIVIALVFYTAVQQAHADTFGSGANTFDIEFVTIGNPGNPADTTGDPNPAGSVPYRYRMGKFEISEQMIDKANALGELGITKDTRGPDKPATSVSWNEAARFVNWLNTSTGCAPPYKFAIQPGEAGYSANANIELWTISDPGYDPSNLYRNSLARYFLPSVHEWYKAAYYDSTSGVYYNYPTGSDSIPTLVTSGTTAGTAVIGHSVGPADITLAGGLSPYGTMGQGGNVIELEETDVDLVNGPTVSSSARVRRGGYWASGSNDLSSSNRIGLNPSFVSAFTGFRVASAIPEPSTIFLVGFALGAIFVFRARFRRPRLFINVAIVACLAPAPTIAHAATLRTVALSGQQAPGTPDGVNYSSFSAPVLNNAGQTAFHGNLSGDGVDFRNDNGIWSEGSGSLALVAREGEQAPGAPSGSYYIMGVLDRPPVLNDAGQTAFRANIAGNNSPHGIWSEGSGTLALVAGARIGNHAPGTPDGVNYDFFYYDPALNNAGQTAFYAELSGPGVIKANVNIFNNNGLGIWSESSGSLALVARTGSQAPGMPSGVSYTNFAPDTALNDVGQIAFWAFARGGGEGIWSEGSGSLALVARSGGQAPGTPSGVNYARFSFCITCPPNHSAYRPALNNAGQTAFRASLTGSGVDSTNDTGIWSEGSGSLALVAREGNQAPGAHDGVNFGDFFDGAYITPALNNAGQITFRAKLAGTGVDSTNDEGIFWSGGSGTLALVARAGSQAAGTPNGVNYQSFSYPALNDAGQTAFHAVLTGAGVDTTNNIGIWATDRSGECPHG